MREENELMWLFMDIEYAARKTMRGFKPSMKLSLVKFLRNTTLQSAFANDRKHSLDDLWNFGVSVASGYAERQKSLYTNLDLTQMLKRQAYGKFILDIWQVWVSGRFLSIPFGCVFSPSIIYAITIHHESKSTPQTVRCFFVGQFIHFR